MFQISHIVNNLYLNAYNDSIWQVQIIYTPNRQNINLPKINLIKNHRFNTKVNLKGERMNKIRKILGIVIVFAMVMALLPSMALAQSEEFHTDEVNSLRTFLNTPSKIPGKTNGQAISSGYNSSHPETWDGIIWTNTNPKRVNKIGYYGEWANKLLTGTLDLSNMSELEYLDCPNNRLTQLITTNDTKLLYVDCTHNRLTNVRYDMYNGHVEFSAVGKGYVGFYTFRPGESDEIKVCGVPEPKAGYYFDGYGNYEELRDPERMTITLDLRDTLHDVSLDFRHIDEEYVYTITFDLNGGELRGGGELEQEVAHNGSAEAPITSREGQYFMGWEGRYQEVREDATVVAKWAPNGATLTPPPKPEDKPTSVPVAAPTYYTVKFDPNGGARTGGGDLTQRILATADALLPVVEFNGHEFAGWDGTCTRVTSDITLKAIWKEYHEVKFDMNGGIQSGGGDLVQSVEYGKAAVAPVVERYGYTFGGWSKSFDKVTENITVYAIWDRKPDVAEAATYRVIYDMNGGTGTAPVDTNEYQEGEMAILADGAGLSMEGYAFVGWSYETDGFALDEEEIWLENSDAILYAVWEAVDEPEPTVIPTGEEDVDETGDADDGTDHTGEVTDIPKTGVATGIFVGVIMLLFGLGIVAFEIVKRHRIRKFQS